MKVVMKILLFWVRFSCSLITTVLMLMVTAILFMVCTGPPYVITRMHEIKVGMNRELPFPRISF